jgi:hypothetical protein
METENCNLEDRFADLGGLEDHPVGVDILVKMPTDYKSPIINNMGLLNCSQPIFKDKFYE